MDEEVEPGVEAECLVRHGLAGRIGWFVVEAPAPDRGETVVLRTSRGIELGEVLRTEPSRSRAGEDSIGPFRVLRAAEPADLEAARDALRLRDSRFEFCRRIIRDEGWPLELVDAEPLPDLSTVLHLLPLDEFDPAMVRARFRLAGEFDVHLEIPGDEPASDPEPAPKSDGGGCGSGCSSCGVAAMRREGRPRA